MDHWKVVKMKAFVKNPRRKTTKSHAVEKPSVALLDKQHSNDGYSAMDGTENEAFTDDFQKRVRHSSCPTAVANNNDFVVKVTSPSTKKKEPDWKRSAKERSRDWSLLDLNEYRFETYKNWVGKDASWGNALFQSVSLLLLLIVLPFLIHICIIIVYKFCKSRGRKGHQNSTPTLFLVLLLVLGLVKDLIIVDIIWYCLLKFSVTPAVLIYNVVLLVIIVGFIYFPTIMYLWAEMTYGFSPTFDITSKHDKKKESTRSGSDSSREEKGFFEQLLTIVKPISSVRAEINMFVPCFRNFIPTFVASIVLGLVVVVLASIHRPSPTLPGKNYTASSDIANNTTQKNFQSNIRTDELEGFLIVTGLGAGAVTTFVVVQTLLCFGWRLNILRNWKHINMLEGFAETSAVATGIEGIRSWFQAIHVLYFFSWSPFALTCMFRVTLYCLLGLGILTGLFLIAALESIAPFAVLLLYMSSLFTLQMILLLVSDILLIFQEKKAKSLLSLQLVSRDLELALISMENEQVDYEYQIHLKRFRARNLRSDIDLIRDVMTILTDRSFGQGFELCVLGIVFAVCLYTATLISVALKENDFSFVV